MTLNNEPRTYPVAGDYTGGPLFGGIEIFAGLLVLLMILGPMAAGATHANPNGWGQQQQEQTR